MMPHPIVKNWPTAPLPDNPPLAAIAGAVVLLHAVEGSHTLLLQDGRRYDAPPEVARQAAEVLRKLRRDCPGAIVRVQVIVEDGAVSLVAPGATG